jgi:protein TonB
VKPCEVSASGGNIRPPMKLKDVRPIYPQAAADAGVGGSVILDAGIGGDGRVNDVTIREGSNPDLASAAADAVRQWEFSPTLLNCTPIEVAMQVNVRFEPRN